MGEGVEGNSRSSFAPSSRLAPFCGNREREGGEFGFEFRLRFRTGHQFWLQRGEGRGGRRRVTVRVSPSGREREGRRGWEGGREGCPFQVSFRFLDWHHLLRRIHFWECHTGSGLAAFFGFTQKKREEREGGVGGSGSSFPWGSVPVRVSHRVLDWDCFVDSRKRREREGVPVRISPECQTGHGGCRSCQARSQTGTFLVQVRVREWVAVIMRDWFCESSCFCRHSGSSSLRPPKSA